MKQLCTLAILLSFFLISTNATIKKGNKKIKSFSIPPKKVEIRRLQSDNETEAPSDLYDSTEPTTDEIETTIPDTTVPATTQPATTVPATTAPTTYVPPPTTVPVPQRNYEPEPEAISGFWLYGFDGFNVLTPTPTVAVVTIVWTTYFRYVGGHIPLFVTFTAAFYYNSGFRNLEESEETPDETEKVNCYYNESYGGESFLKYDCRGEAPADMADISRIEILPEVEVEGRKLSANALTLSLDAQNQMSNILNQRGDIYGSALQFTKAYNLQNGTLEADEENRKFYIRKLNLNIKNSESEKAVLGSHIFTFRYHDRVTNQTTTRERQCSVVKNSDGETYDIECEVEKNGDFRYWTNNALSIDKESNLAFNVLVDGKDYADFYDKETKESTQNSTSYSRSYFYNKSSKGLSGGAIAGIVIVCIVALVVISVLVILLRRRKVGRVEENDSTASALGMNNI